MVQTTYTVDGMTCDHCAGSVTAEVVKIGGVTDVRVDVQARTLTVGSESPLTRDAVDEAVEEAGYHVVSEETDAH